MLTGSFRFVRLSDGTAIGNGGVGDGKGARALNDVALPFSNDSRLNPGQQRWQLDLLQVLNRE